MKKYPGIKKQAQGVYRVRVTRRDAAGRRLERDRVCVGSLQDARELQIQLEAELDAEIHGVLPPPGATLTDYARLWIEQRASRLKPSTVAKYVNDLEKHILPALGSRRIEDLRPSDIKGFLAADPGKGYSVVNRLRLLRTIAKDALADSYTERDFCARVQAPAVVVYTDEQPNLLTAEQLDALLEVIPEHWLDLVYLLGLTGLRWGEVSGLRWKDVDLERGVVVIRRGNWKGTALSPKTDAAWRTVPLSAPLPERLTARRERMRELGPGAAARDLVFPTKRGTLHRGTPLRSVLKRGCKLAGIEIRFTPHGLRRTFNDMARRLADPLVLRSLVGHTTEAMTEHYSRIDAEEKRQVTDAVAEQLRCARRPLAGDDGDGKPAAGGDPGGEQAVSEAGPDEKDE